MLRPLLAILVGLALGWTAGASPAAPEDPEHGGGLNHCGCHFNRKTGECHCHRDYGCGCKCEPTRCG